jgi:hypothetical protein
MQLNLGIFPLKKLSFSFMFDGLRLTYFFLWMNSGGLVVGSLERIFQKEGFRGLYRGLSPTILALLPNWAVS